MRLFSSSWVLPVATAPLRDGAVVVSDEGDGAISEGAPRPGTVIAVGPRDDLRRAFTGIPETRGEGVLTPALVNAHAHLELSWLAGTVAGGDGVVAWTRRLAARLGDAPAQNESAVDEAAESAARAARALGTAAIGDVGNGTAGWRALGRTGMRGLFFHELVGSREARTGDALADAARERDELRAALESRAQVLEESRGELRGRAERAERDLDAARAELARVLQESGVPGTPGASRRRRGAQPPAGE